MNSDHISRIAGIRSGADVKPSDEHDSPGLDNTATVAHVPGGDLQLGGLGNVGERDEEEPERDEEELEQDEEELGQDEEELGRELEQDEEEQDEEEPYQGGEEEEQANYLSEGNYNVVRLLGREGFYEVMRRIIRVVGRYPSMDSFPILDASDLRPFHRFSDSRFYDRDLLSLVRPNFTTYTGRHNRAIGSDEFFVGLDQIVDTMDEHDLNNPLPIALQRHPNLIHSHPFMAHRPALHAMSDIVFSYQDLMRTIAPVYNALHRELRILILYLLYIISRFDQAASYGDLVNCIKCLDLIDNVSTSLRGLMEMEYALREVAQEAGT